MWCVGFSFWFCFDSIELTHEQKMRIFFYIDQSITVIEFRVYVISSPYSTSVYFFLFRLNVTHCLNYFVGLHCCYCFGVTIFRPSFKQFIEQICCVCFKCWLSGFWSPYRWLQNRISNSTTTLKTTYVFYEEYLLSIRFVNLCAHTRTRFECWPTTKNKIDCRFGWSEENQTTTTTKKTDRRVDRRRKNLLSAYAYVYKCKFQAVFVTLVSAPKILKSRYCFVLFLFLLCFFLLLAYLLAFDIGRVWVYLYICAGLCVSFPFWLLLLYYIWVYDSHCWWWWQWSSVYCCKSIVIICFAVCCRHCRSAVIHKLNILVTYQQFVVFFLFWLFLYDCVYAFNVILNWCGGTSAMKIN